VERLSAEQLDLDLRRFRVARDGIVPVIGL